MADDILLYWIGIDGVLGEAMSEKNQGIVIITITGGGGGPRVSGSLTKISNWISVKDRLPEVIFANYLCAVRNGIRIREFHPFCGKRPRFWFHGVEDKNVTHWMPLPNPPEEE